MLPLRALTSSARHLTVMAEGDETLTGGRLAHAADAMAAVLDRLGIRSGDRVAVMLGNTTTFAIVFIALMKLRASAVFIDAQARGREVSASLARSGAVAILGSDTLASLLADVPDVVSGPAWTDAGAMLGLWRTIHRERSAGVDELMVQFTSGSAGRAKVVPRTVASLEHELRRFAARCDMLSAAGVTICPVPLSHSYGLLNGLLLPLFTGRPTVVLRGALAPNAIVRAVQRWDAEVLVGVPAIYRGIATAHGAAATELRSLRICFSAGSPLPADVAATFTAKFGRRINQQYGSTETGIIAANLDESLDPQSVGRPLAVGEVAVCREDGTPASAGEIGEVVVESRATTAGYLDDPELSARQFRNGRYSTGDLASIDGGGALALRGRRTMLIDVGGFKVDPREVEHVLAMHEAIVECVVVAHRQRDGQAIKAIVVPRRRVSAQEVQRFCREHLTAYKVPRHVAIVDRLPRSPSGKILLKELVD